MPTRAVRWLPSFAIGVLLLVSLSVFAGCGARTTSDRDLVLIEHPELQALQEQAREGGRGSRLMIVDVRSAERFAEGHIPGAVNIHLAEIRRNDPRLAGADHIVTYGRDWQDPRGPAAAKQLIQLGYGKVYDFRGGLELWEARGGAIIRSRQSGE